MSPNVVSSPSHFAGLIALLRQIFLLETLWGILMPELLMKKTCIHHVDIYNLNIFIYILKPDVWSLYNKILCGDIKVC